MGVKERYEKRQQEDTVSYFGVEQRYMAKESKNVASSIKDRVNIWLKNHSDYVSNYHNRFAGRDYSYGDTYISDSGSWLKTVSKQKDNFDAEAQSILSYMDQHKDYLDEDWMKSVREKLTGAGDQQNSIVEAATGDRDFWTQFDPTEDQKVLGYTAEDLYGQWYKEDGYRKKYQGMTYAQVQEAITKLDDGDVTQYDSKLDDINGRLKNLQEQLHQLNVEGNADFYFSPEEIELARNLKDQIRKLSREKSEYERKRDNGVAPENEEKKWLTDNLESFMTPDDYDNELVKIDNQIQNYQEQLHQLNVEGNADFYFTPGEIELGHELQDKLEALSQKKTRYENERKYSFIPENEDFAQTSAFRKEYADDTLYSSVNNKEDKAQYMSEGELGTFNTIWHTEGKEAAEAYYEYLQPELNARKQGEKRMEMAVYATKNPFGASIESVGQTLISGVGYLDALGQRISKDLSGDYYAPIDYNTDAMTYANSASAIRSTVAQNLANDYGVIDINEADHPILAKIFNGKSLGDVYQLGMSMVDSAAVAVLSPVFGSAGTALLGGSAATQGMLDAAANGASDAQALSMGFLNGAFEMVFEKYSLESLLNADTKNIIKAALRQGLAEGSEETFTSIANNVADILVMAEKSGYKKNVQKYRDLGYSESKAVQKAVTDMGIEIGWDFLGGMLTGGIMGGSTTAIKNAVSKLTETAKVNAQYKNAGRKIVGNTAAVEGLTALANELDGISTYDLAKQAQSVSKKATSKNVGRLLVEVSSTINTQNSKDLSARLQEKGIAADRAASIAEAVITARTDRSSLTREQVHLLEAVNEDAAVVEAVGEILDTEGSAAYQRSAQLQSALSAISESVEQAENGNANESIPGLRELAQQKVDDEYAAAHEGQVLEDEIPSAEGKILRGNTAVEIADIDSKDGKSLKVKLTDGSTADVAELSFPDAGEQELWRVIGEYAESAEAARMLLKEFRAGNLDAYKFARGAEEGFLYGMANISPGEMETRGSYVNLLDPMQRNMAYRQGQIAGERKARQRLAEASQRDPSRRRKGAVHYGYEGEKLDKSKLKLTQRVGVDFAERLAKKKGMTFYFFRSYVKDGMRVFKNAAGEIVALKENGWYDPSDGSIHIDLNCGDMGSTVLYTIAHELGHFIKDWSPVRYRILCGIVTKGFLDQGQSVRELVLNKQKDYADKGVKLTWEEAYDEVIASSMEGIIDDGRVMDLLDAAENKDKGLAQQIKSFLQDIAQLIRDTIQAYRDVDPESPEGNMVRRMDGIREQLQEAFAEALHEGGENYREGGKINTAQSGGVKYSLNINAKAELHKALYDKNYRDDVLLRDETPTIMLSQKNVRNLSMAMKASHIRENVFTEAEARQLGLPVNSRTHYHGLGETFFLQVIDGLDNVKEAYRGTKNADNAARRENYFLLISEFTDTQGNIINVPVYIDEHVQVNRVFIDVNKISTVFGKENLRDYIAREIRKGNIVRIKNRSNPTSERSAPIAEGYSRTTSKNSIRNPEQKVNKNSLRYEKNETAQAYLQEQNASMDEDVAGLNQLVAAQRKQGSNGRLKRGALDAAASFLMKTAGAKGNKNALIELLNTFYQYVATGTDLSWEGVREQAKPVVRWLMENTVKNDLEYEYSREIIEQDLLNRVYDSYWNASTLYSVADQYEKQIRELKGKHKQRMNAVYQRHRAAEQNQKIAYQQRLEAAQAHYEEQYQRREKEYRESRQRAVERHDKAQVRQKIKRVVRDLWKLQERAPKHRRTKEELRDFVDKALKAADLIWLERYDEYDMVRNGIDEKYLRGDEKRLLEECRELLNKHLEVSNNDIDTRWDIDAALQQAKDKAALDKELAKRMKILRNSGVFAEEFKRLHEMDAGQILKDLMESYKKLQQTDSPYLANAYQEKVQTRLQEIIDDVGVKPIRNMTLQELEKLHEAYSAVLHVVQNANKLFADERAGEVTTLGTRIVNELANFAQKVMGRKFMETLRKTAWNNLTPAYVFRRIGSATLERLYKNMVKGMGTYGRDIAEAKAHWQKQAKKFGAYDWDMDKRTEFLDKTGKKFSLSLGQLMSLYALSRRQQALGHLEIGGIRLDANDNYVENLVDRVLPKVMRDASVFKLDKAALEAICSKLTPEQKAFVEATQGYLSTVLAEKGNEVSMKLYGIRLFREKIYFPLRTANDTRYQSTELIDQNKLKNSGFTKEPNPNANNAVILSDYSKVWTGHVKQMSLYHGMTLPMEDMDRMLNFGRTFAKDENGNIRKDENGNPIEEFEGNSISATLRNIWGEHPENYIRELMKQLNGDIRIDAAEDIPGKMFSRFKKSAVAGSLSVWIQQWTSVFRAMAYIPMKYFFQKPMGTQRTAIIEEMKKHCPIAIIKEMGGFDTGIGSSEHDYITMRDPENAKELIWEIKKHPIKRFDEFTSLMPNRADVTTWAHIWTAVKRETRDKHPELKMGSEEFYKAASERFTEVINLTQVYDSILSKSALMRSKGFGAKMITQFAAEPTMVLNMAVDAMLQTRRTGKLQVGTACALVASVVANAMSSALIYALRDDDEEETFWEKYSASMLGNLVDGLNPLMYMPIIRDIWSAAQGYDVKRSDRKEDYC